MKKLIDGRRYDTDAAKMLGSYTFLTPDNPAYWKETLYRKRTGEYFLHGCGGSMSRYAEPAGGSDWTDGEKLFPMTPDEAKEWARKCLGQNEYERLFEIPEDGEKRVTTFFLSEAVIAMIKLGAVERNISLSEYVAECVKACAHK